MEEKPKETVENATEGIPDIRMVIREAIAEYKRQESLKTEPAYKSELAEERRRREQLERRLNELVQENERNRQIAEEAERNALIRAELQRLGVVKVDLAYKAVKDDVKRTEDGRLVAISENGTLSLRDYLKQFVAENPEFLPARNLGGSGVGASQRLAPQSGPAIDLEKIRPGMNPEELERVRQEVAKIASQTLGGQ